MEKDLVNIISEKKYNELTQEELAEVQDYCAGEEEYDQMREVFIAMNMIKPEDIKPSEKVKADLDALFDQQHPKAPLAWYMSALEVIAPKEKKFSQQPLVRIAAVALLFLIVYPIVNNTLTVNQNSSTRMAKAEERKNDKQDFVQEEITSETEQFKSVQEQTVEPENYLVEKEGLMTDMELDDVTAARDEFSPVSSMDATVFSSTRSQPMSAGSSAPATGYLHPDGVYIPAGNAENAKSESVAVSKAPELLDLLTATF